MSTDLNSDEQFSFDIKRSIILAEYIKCWGMPEARNLMPQSKAADEKSMPIELYLFPGEDMDQVTRLATIGLSSCKFYDDKSCNNELLMVLPFDVADEQWESVSQYIFEISNYIVNTLGRNVKSEDLRKEAESAPADWPKALLFDDPRGEPNELNHFYIGMQHVTLSWAVPIFASEYELIKASGIESFDAAVADAETSLVEIRRDECV
ncbi:MAG: suppressor of fused domain protein [Oleispira sp.]